MSIIESAKKLLGVPYVWGGESFEEGGFDCSGFTYYVMKENGINIPRTSDLQFSDSTGTLVTDKSLLQPGDLVFFNGYLKDGRAGHVGIYLGNDEYIHAPKTGDVIKVSKLSSRGDYLGAKRYTDDAGLIGGNGLFGFPSWNEILSSITKFLVILLILVLAVVFFMKAFDIKL